MDSKNGASNHAPLLNFLYLVTFDESVQESFNDNPVATMKQYNLSPEAQRAIQAAGPAPAPDASKLKAITDLLVPELEATYHPTW